MDEGPLRESLEGIHARHRGPILAYLTRLTHDPALAEDLTQETFLRVSRGLSRFRGDSKLGTWIYRIATNVYLDQRRRDASRTPGAGYDLRDLAGPSSVVPQEPRLPDRLLEDSEMASCIREYVDGLPPDHAAVIVLHDLQGLANPEIARILGCSLETVKIRIHRARRRLAQVLGEHCDFHRSDDDALRCDRKQPTGH
jgi:RNA polymerase sigma-70 factor (ECF subfamily)